MKISTLLYSSLALPAANAAKSAYAQCGGKTFKGETACGSGYRCHASNDLYSQCVPHAAKSLELRSRDVSVRTLWSNTSVIGQDSSFAKVDGSAFNFDGKTQHFMGTNTYWIGFLENHADVDQVMSHLKETGLKILRVWGFNDVNTIPSLGTAYFQALVKGSEPLINTGTDGLQRLDYVVESAEAHGIKLIIPFVNYWDDYGGMAAYASYYGIEKTAWFSSTEAQAQYQKYAAAVVSRYVNSPAIFAWELANEPRCKGCDTSVITEWAQKSSAYIKSLDSKHMVTLGDEGFGLKDADTSYPFTFAEGTDWATNLAIDTIDFGTIHLYPEHWEEEASWGSYWIEAHAKAAATIGKPFILEEYGHSKKSEIAPWQATVLTTDTAGDLYWQYGEQLSIGLTADDGFSIYYGTSDYDTLVTKHATAMSAKA